MSRGLAEFDQSDGAFNGALIYRGLLTAALTCTWNLVATKSRMFEDPKMLKYSIPVAVLVSFFFSKGIVYHYMGVKETNRRREIERIREFQQYKNEMRHKGIYH
jgi:hypothetical protein